MLNQKYHSTVKPAHNVECLIKVMNKSFITLHLSGQFVNCWLIYWNRWSGLNKTILVFTVRSECCCQKLHLTCSERETKVEKKWTKRLKGDIYVWAAL